MSAGAKWTPGPLKLGRSRDGSKVIVADARTRTVAQFYRPERDADAQLFVHAPALVEALAMCETTLGALVRSHEAEPFREHMDPAQRFQNDMRNALAAASSALALARGDAKEVKP